MLVNIKIIHAFSIDGKGGNPAGVVFDADGLSSEQKQLIASKVGYPETAFVSASSIAGYKLDFFTPVKQIAHCGHATIATFSFLKQAGKIEGNYSSKETIDGTRSIRFDKDMAFMEQRSPVYHFPEEDYDQILDSVNLKHSDLIPGLQPTIVNTGNSFIIIPVKSASVLSAVSFDKKAVCYLSEKLGLIGYYLWAIPDKSLFDATTRMFAPYYGIEEEAATGMAAGPLACYLFRISINKKYDFVIEQGKYMRPASRSLIRVKLEAEQDNITSIFAGGHAYVAAEKIIQI